MSKHDFVVLTVARWVHEHTDWLAVNRIRTPGIILNVGCWLDLEAELVAEATRLWDARPRAYAADDEEQLALELEAA